MAVTRMIRRYGRWKALDKGTCTWLHEGSFATGTYNIRVQRCKNVGVHTIGRNVAIAIFNIGRIKREGQLVSFRYHTIISYSIVHAVMYMQ
jgi:hypothetical protein